MQLKTFIKVSTAAERQRLFDDMAIQLDLKPEFKEYLLNNGFLEAPASLKHHGTYDGALFDHSLAVTSALVDLTESLDLFWFRPQSPYIVGFFHDLCKIDDYKRGQSGAWEWNKKPIVIGHGEKSVTMLKEFIELTEEEEDCICYHMGAFVNSDFWKDYSDAVERYPNVLFTHTADMYAAHVLGV